MANWKLGKTQYGSLKTATSGGTLVLVASSKQFQILTGSSSHTVQLPDATTTSNGTGICFTIINESTGSITVKDNGSNTLTTISANGSAEFLLTNAGSANGTWRVGALSATAGSGIGNVAPGSTKTTNYSIVSGDKDGVINVDTTGGAITVTLPAPAANFAVTVKDLKGTSGVNNITVAPNSTETIDKIVGSDTISTAFSSVTYISDGTNWVKMAEFTGNDPTLSAGRGFFGGGSNGGDSSAIDYIAFATAANAASFGTLTAGFGKASCSSSVRAVWAGGVQGGSDTNAIQYITAATLGNGTSFGTLTQARGYFSGANSSTRGVFGGGFLNSVTANNTIDYITIATTSNATSFGTLAVNHAQVGACTSATRGLWAGGNSGGAPINNIDYVTIATTANANSFGTLSTSRDYISGCSSSIRGLFGAGFNGTYQANIDFVTMATTGNGTNFGNLTTARYAPSSCSSKTIGCWGGGSNGSNLNSIEQVTIGTASNATSFGNLTGIRRDISACSNANGGL